MVWRVRVLKILLGGVVGALGASLAWLIFSLLPSSSTRGAPPQTRVAVVVDTSVRSVSPGSGLGSAMLGSLSTVLRPVPRAARSLVGAVGGAWTYAFDSTGRRIYANQILGQPSVAGTDGALAQALALVEIDLAKEFGPKLVCIWLDRPSVGAADMAAAKRLRALGWEIRIYGTEVCDADAMRSMASDIHFAFREPKPGLEKGTRLAVSEVPKRAVALLAGFTERPPLSDFGKAMAAFLAGLFVVTLLGIFQGLYHVRPVGRTLIGSLGVGVPTAAAAALVAHYCHAPSGWISVIGLGSGIVLGVFAANPRWLALLFGPAECSMLLGWLPLPVDLVWGLALLGLGIGIAAVFSEEISRRRYLVVRDGNRIRLLNLGRREVSFGSASSCSYRLKDGNGRVAAVRYGPEGAYRVDTLTGRIRNFHPGEAQRIGRLSVAAHVGGGWRRIGAGASEGPLVLRIGEVVLQLAEGSKFTAADLPVTKGSMDGIVGEVTLNPLQQGVLGLTNRSGADWSATLPTGAVAAIPPGKTVRLAAGTRISFGAGDGVVEAGP